ncbi:GNAT family N-acetyltransferase [Arthrobacter sp. SA17]
MVGTYGGGMDETTVREASLNDVESWMALTGEVESLFGPMPGIVESLERGILRGTAYVCCTARGLLIGAMLLSGSAPAKITWLAVSRSARRQGVGSLLVSAAILHFGDQEIFVDTFGDENASGRPAVLLYSSFGFCHAENLEPGPEGASRQRLRRPAHSMGPAPIPIDGWHGSTKD